MKAGCPNPGSLPLRPAIYIDNVVAWVEVSALIGTLAGDIMDLERDFRVAKGE